MTNRIAHALASLALAGSLVALPGAALAQDEPAPTDLAALFPDTVGGAELAVEILDGPAWLERQDTSTADGQLVVQRTEELVAAAEKSIDDLSIASALHRPGEGDQAAISAVQVAGAAASDLVRPTIALLLGDITNPAIRIRPLGSKDVLRVSDADLPGTYPKTVYPFGDTVWVVEAEQPALLEIVEALPGEAEEAPVDPVPELLAATPLLLGNEARSHFQVSSGWIDPFETAPGEMFGPPYEEVELRLYLDEGVTADDLDSVLAVWDEPAEGVVIVGYQIDDADTELMRAVLNDVIVPAITATIPSQQPAVGERELAGRALTVVTDEEVDEADRALSTYNFLVVDDTVWMINLATGDEAVLTEALEKLPSE
jgi:hypothetical protein